MTSFKILTLAAALLLFGCIKNDYVDDKVDPELRITSTVDTIALGSTYQFESMYLNNVGQEENVTVQWYSSAPSIISINENDGLAEAHEEGSTTITAEYSADGVVLQDSRLVHVGENTTSGSGEKSGSIATTSSYNLSGDFVLRQEGEDLILEFAENYEASTALPGLYVYLSNNKNTVANAFEVAKVEVFSGVHSYTIEGVGINDYSYLLYFCKPFNVKVGDGEIL